MRTDGWVSGWTDWQTKLTVAFRHFANAPKHYQITWSRVLFKKPTANQIFNKFPLSMELVITGVRDHPESAEPTLHCTGEGLNCLVFTFRWNLLSCLLSQCFQTKHSVWTLCLTVTWQHCKLWSSSPCQVTLLCLTSAPRWVIQHLQSPSKICS